MTEFDPTAPAPQRTSVKMVGPATSFKALKAQMKVQKKEVKNELIDQEMREEIEH